MNFNKKPARKKLNLQRRYLGMCAFIDCTLNATCRPGGPARDGTGAPRNDQLIQRAFFNGWKKKHGWKWQTVDLPNGIYFHVYGPESLRHNDLFLLGESGLNDLIRDCQVGQHRQHVIYGDSAYIVINDTHIRCRYFNEPLTAFQDAMNCAFSSCRECIEWDNGNVGTMWSMVDFSKGLEIQSMPVADMYFCISVLCC